MSDMFHIFETPWGVRGASREGGFNSIIKCWKVDALETFTCSYSWKIIIGSRWAISPHSPMLTSSDVPDWSQSKILSLQSKWISWSFFFTHAYNRHARLILHISFRTGKIFTRRSMPDVKNWKNNKKKRYLFNSCLFTRTCQFHFVLFNTWRWNGRWRFLTRWENTKKKLFSCYTFLSVCLIVL